MLPKIVNPAKKKKKKKHKHSNKKKTYVGNLIVELRYFQPIEIDSLNDNDDSTSLSSSTSRIENDDDDEEESEFVEPSSSSSDCDEVAEFRQRLNYLDKIECGKIQIKRAVVPVPSSFVELQGHFTIAFPQHDALLMVEREDGSQILPHETRFNQNEVIIFREFQPFSRREAANTRGIVANWEQLEYLPSNEYSRTVHKNNNS